MHDSLITANVLFGIAHTLLLRFIVLNTIHIGALQEIREQLHEFLALLRGDAAPSLQNQSAAALLGESVYGAREAAGLYCSRWSTPHRQFGEPCLGVHRLP